MSSAKRVRFLACAAAALTVRQAAGETFSITDVGTFGGATSAATAINSAGQVSGYAQNAAGSNRAFIYSGGTLTSLGTLGGDSFAYAINNNGQLAGYFQTAMGQDHA